jgi:hypothetical protein
MSFPEDPSYEFPEPALENGFHLLGFDPENNIFRVHSWDPENRTFLTNAIQPSPVESFQLLIVFKIAQEVHPLLVVINRTHL